MPKLYSAKEVIKTLRRAGFEIVSQRGSHIKLKGLNKGHLCIVIVPNHRQIARGTFESILKQADITHKEFEYFYR